MNRSGVLKAFCERCFKDQGNFEIEMLILKDKDKLFKISVKLFCRGNFHDCGLLFKIMTLRVFLDFFEVMKSERRKSSTTKLKVIIENFYLNLNHADTF